MAEFFLKHKIYRTKINVRRMYYSGLHNCHKTGCLQNKIHYNCNKQIIKY